MRIILATHLEVSQDHLKQSLDSFGHPVITIENDDQALDLIRKRESSELWIYDWEFSHKAIPEFIQRLQETSDRAPAFLILLAPPNTDPAKISAALKSGAHDFLTKPINILQFETRIHQAIENLKQKELLAIQHIRLIHSFKLSALAEMASGIGHEINNPLAIISGSAQSLENREGEPPPTDYSQVLKAVERINRSTKRIVNAVQGLIMFGEGSSTGPLKQVELDKLLETTLLFNKSKFQNHDIEVRLKKTSQETQTLCRPNEISQVIWCLLNNARDAVKNASERWVEIEFGETQEKLEISISDSGHGVESNIRERIFEPFFTTHTQDKGIGLGLTISREIILAHSGTLFLDYSSKNTRFVFTLPKCVKSN